MCPLFTEKGVYMKRIIYMLLVLAIMTTGCGTGNKTRVENKFEKKDENIENVKKESSGQISFGYLNEKKDVYEYNGKDVEIPFYLENQGNKNESVATIGLLLFVDGNIQDYRIEANGKIQTMQKITLKPKERKEFKLIFKPVSGKKGDKVGVIPATIWNPDSLPNEKNPSWGNNQQLSANVPLEIKMKSNGTNQLKATKKHVKVSDIPEEILNDWKNTSVNFEMESSVKDKQILYGKNRKVPITLKLYGGASVNEKITIFINNKPVKIDKKDYIKVKTQKGKMITVTANLDLSGYDRINSIYAIVMTSGGDYKIQDISKTDSLLLINK